MGRRSIVFGLVLAALAMAPHAAVANCTHVEHDVTTTADVVNGSDGVLSLREAIADANGDPNTFDCHDVKLPAGHYTLSIGPLAVTAALVNVEPAVALPTSSHDVVIDGNNATALFSVGSNSQLEARWLTLENGTPAITNSGTTLVDNATLSANHVAGSGGALFNGAGAELQVYASTLVGNYVTAPSKLTAGDGGAIYSDGNLIVSASTLVANGASGVNAGGGAIFNNGSLLLAHSTLDHNTVAFDLSGGGADVFNVSGKTAQTQDTLYGSGCNAQLTPVGAEGASLSSDGTCATAGGDLRLGPLQDNGGGTDTEMLLAGSPAIDAYTLQCLGFDQRGVGMPQGAKCDAGAYELITTGDLALAADSGSLAVTVGSTFPVTVRIASSTSPVDATESNDVLQPTLTEELPSGLSYVSGPDGCSASGQTVTCLPGPVQTNGPPVAVTLQLHADAAGSFTDAADVSSPRSDTNQLDNHVGIVITATPPQQQGGGGSAPPPAASLKLAGKPKVRGSTVRFTLTCSGAPCAGNAAILVAERLRGHAVSGLRRPARSASTRTVALASRRFTIAAGARKTLTLQLSQAGRRLLARFHRVPARLRVRLGSTTAATAALTFKRRR